MASMDGFNANEVPDAIILPPGKYTGIVTASEIKPTAKGGTQYVFSIRITDGPQKDAMLFWRLNKTLATPNPTAKLMADRELKKLCIATGRMTPRDTADFHNIRVAWVVENEVRKDAGHEGEISNVIKSVEPLNAQPTAAIVATPAPAGTPAPAKAPAWRRNANTAPAAAPVTQDVADPETGEIQTPANAQ